MTGNHKSKSGSRQLEGSDCYRSLLETVFEGIGIYEGESLVEANAGFARMFGYTQSEVIGKSVNEFVAVEARDQFVRDVLAGGQQPYETLGLKKDGTTFYAELVVKRHSSQEHETYIVAVRDVTKRKQTQEKLLRLSSALMVSTDSIVVTDLDGKIVDVNPAALKLFGITDRRELIGKDAVELVVQEGQGHTWNGMIAALENGAVQGYEYRLVTKNGKMVPLEVSAAMIKDTRGTSMGFVGIGRDIAERNLMAETLQQRNHELELLNLSAQALNASLDLDQVLDTTLEKVQGLLDVEACSVWLIEPETDELVCHSATGPHGNVVFGWRLPPGEGLAGWVAQSGRSLVVSDTLSDRRHFRDIEQQTGTVLRSAISIPMRIKEDIIGVLQVLHAAVDRFKPTDLVLVESLATSAAIALENARLYKDLQERMEELKDTQAHLIQSAKMAAIGELAAGLAHELNTPLTSVMGFSELLLERAADDDPGRQKLEAIVRQSCRARDIVHSLLSFSRQAEFLQEPADLNLVMRETLMLVRRRLETRDIALEEQYASALPLVSLDVGRIRQVFLNLVNNALYVMPEGGTLAVRTARAKDGILVHIADTGEGIPPEDLSRIFEPFFTTKPVGQGTGLGLSVSLGIVQEHGGRIEVDSRVGKGSTFTVWLPVPAKTEKT